MLGGLTFLSPWLLLALAGLPVLWWLLRLTPPAPRRLSFPAIRLLFDLVPPEETPQRTPPWLILLRLLLAALIIIGFAEPLLNAQGELAGSKALMLVVDNSWAAGPGWPARQRALGEAVDQAERFGVPVILLRDRAARRWQRHCRCGSDEPGRCQTEGPRPRTPALAQRPHPGVAGPRPSASGPGHGGQYRRAVAERWYCRRRQGFRHRTWPRRCRSWAGFRWWPIRRPSCPSSCGHRRPGSTA